MNSVRFEIGRLERSTNWQTWKYKISLLLRSTPGTLDIIQGKVNKPEPPAAPALSAKLLEYKTVLDNYQSLDSHALLILTATLILPRRWESITVFQAECMGISLAALAIMAREVKDHSIRILSDSMAVLQALNSHTVDSGLIYECHQRLNEVGSLNNITIQWIKGHSGSLGNDAADELARRGSSMTPVGPEPIAPLPFGYLRTLVRKRTRDQHHKIWLDLSECRQAKEALPAVDARLTKQVLRLTKPQLRTVTAAVTGHGSFNKHLFVIGVTDSPLCRACMEDDETAAHVLLNCPVVANYRAKYFGNPGTLREIVSNTKALLAFLEELGWIE